MNTFFGMGLGIAILGLSACGGSSSGGAATPTTELANAISLIASGVEETGSALGSPSLLNAKHFSGSAMHQKSFGLNPFAITAFDSSMCDEHGRPQSGGSPMSESAEEYPYAHTYCALTTNDGDTVRGGFGLAQSLICSLEKGGITFNGTTQTITPDFTDTGCWPDGGPGGDETPDGIVMSAVGSSPASFNPYFEKGVQFSVDALGLSFSIAANLEGDTIEFIAREIWDGANAGDSAGDTGVMSGSLNKTTGVLSFEKRDERIRSTCSASRCGFNRHTRLTATLGLSASGEPENLTGFQYAYADTQITAAALADGTATTSSAKVVTAASDDIGSEIKAKLFAISGKTTAQIATVGQWSSSETVNTACGSASVGINDSGDCSTQDAADIFSTNAKFLLRGGQQSVNDWTSNFGGFNFTSINLDNDVVYN